MQFTVFGSAEAEIAPIGFTAFTMYGYTKLKRPTLAQRVMQKRRQRQQTQPSRLDVLMGRDRSMVITLFGGTDIVAPTLVEEYSALRNLLQSGSITKDECRGLIQGLSLADESEISRFTMFGACNYSKPTLKAERKALEAAEDLGTITATVRHQLVEAIGAADVAVAGIVARAAMA